MLLLSTRSLKGYGLHKIFLFAKKAGYEGIDLYMDPNSYDSWDKDYLKSLSETFDIPIVSLTGFEKSITREMVDDIVELAKFVDAKLITFCPPRFTDKNPERFTKYLARVSKQERIVISAKNVEPKMLFFIIPEYRNNANLGDIKKATGYTSLSLSNVDKSSGMDILKAHSILGSSLMNIYLSDKKGPKGGLLPGKAGGGISYLPLESFLMKLKTSSYQGYLTLDIQPKELEVGNNKLVLENLVYAREYYEKHFLNFK